MDKHEKVHRAQSLDKQNEVAQAHRQTERRQRNVVSKYAKGAQVNTSEFAANRTAEKGNKRRETPSAWTKANPKFKYGEAMLREKENDSCCPSSVALHTYYLAACAEQKVGIMVNFNPS